jgi:hypothetical protein
MGQDIANAVPLLGHKTQRVGHKHKHSLLPPAVAGAATSPDAAAAAAAAAAAVSHHW